MLLRFLRAALMASAASACAALTVLTAVTMPGVALADDELPPVVAAALARAQIPTAAVGVMVRRVNLGDRSAGAAGPPDAVAPARSAGRGETPVLLALHADRPMNPASTMKLVTTWAALETLGPTYAWKTVLASTAPQNGDVLDGDLVLRGGGDPKFVVEHLWLMLRQLRGRGIRVINGDLVLDRSLFEAFPYDPSAFDNEPHRPYNVAPDALLVNFKAITLRFVPDDAQRIVRIASEPMLAGFEIGTVPYADGPCGDWKGRVGVDYSRSARIGFAGSYPGSCGEQTWNVAVLEHRQYVGALFRSLWSEVGGTLTGTVRDGATPIDARVLVEHESPSLAEVIRDINKYSNNVMARELFLTIGAEQPAGPRDVSRPPANTERAQRALRAFYDGRSIAMPELVVDNGSGLSRRERISAASLSQVLQAAWGSALMPEFVASLPLVGLDGTMRKRLNQSSVAGQAHVKTGTLSDARAVAGYVLSASGHGYTVVVFVNHPNAGAAQPAQDALLRWIYENG